MWLIVVLASLVFLFVLVLSVPLELVLRVAANGRPRFSLRLVWLFGLVSKDLSGRRKKAKKQKARPEAGPKPGKRRMGARRFLKILRTRGVPGRVKIFITDVLGTIRFRELRADLRVGLENPADTGLMFAVVSPALIFLSPYTGGRISLRPAFEGAVLEGYLRATVRLVPIRLVFAVLRLVFSLAMARVLKTAVGAKWRR